jgi:hypothetical protein
MVIFVAMALPVHSSAKAGDRLSRCAEVLVSGSKKSWKYIKDVGTSGGLRLFFKPHTESKFKFQKYGGFITPKSEYYPVDEPIINKFRATFQFVPTRVIGLFRGSEGHWMGCKKGDPDWVFTPFNGIQHCLLDTPIAVVSERLPLKNTYVASLITSLALFITPSILYFDPAWEKLLGDNIEEAQQDLIARKKEELFLLLKYDPRYVQIRNYWIKQNETGISPETIEPIVLRLASELYKANESFFEHFDLSAFSGSTEDMVEIIQYEEFKHLTPYFNKSLDSNKTSTISQKTWRDLVILNSGYQWSLRATPDIFDKFLKQMKEIEKNKDDEEVKRLMAIGLLPDTETRDSVKRNQSKNNLEFSEVEQLIIDSEFFKSVVFHHLNNELSKDEAIGLIKEWLYSRVRVTERKILGLKMPIGFSMEGIEKEILANALSGQNLKKLPNE